jgi:MFS family permease
MKSERGALILSVVMSLVVGAAAVTAASLTQSKAILLDGLFNLIYFLVALVTVRISVLAAQPDDRKFPFGYGYFESLVNAGKGLLILGVALFALVDAVLALLAGGREIVAGPAIGGLVVDAFGWRVVFFLTLPLEAIGVVATVWVMRGWSEVQEISGTRFDWLGAALSTGVLIALMVAMTTGNKAGWTSPPIIAAFAGAVSMLVTFIWWELRTDSPMLDLRLFKGRTFTFGVSAAFLTFLGSSAVLFMMPFYLQNVLGYSAKTAGFVVVPGAFCMAVLGTISGVLSDRFGRRPFTVGGLASSAVGLLILSRVTEDSSLFMVVPALVLMNAGMGIFYSPNSSSVMSTVGQVKYGVVSGFLNLVRNAANVTSIAFATIIVTTTMAAQGYEPSLEAVRQEVEGVAPAFTLGLRYAFVTMAGIVLAGMTLSALQPPYVEDSEELESQDAEESKAEV